MATLRPYQQKALDAMQGDLNNPGASLVVMPTGSGKSLIIAGAALLKQPVLILVPSQELLAQNKAKLEMYVDKNKIGIYSASFNSRQIKTFTFATIQSVYKKPELFKDFQMIIIDECDLVGVKNLGGMFTSFLQSMRHCKIYGLTASPFRVEQVYEKIGNDLYVNSGIKMINRMKTGGASGEIFWKRILFTISHRELLKQGFLCPIEYINEPLVPYTEIPVNKSHSDFNLEAYSQAVVGMEANILNTIAEAQRKYGSVLVFCAEVGQAQRLSEMVKGSAVVIGNTNKKERAQIIEDFKSGKIKTIFGCNCLTTGFDFPGLSCIVNLRPCRSPRLIMQIAGRLSRVAPGKEKGVLVDLTGTYEDFGPVEDAEVIMEDGWAWTLKTKYVKSWHGKMLFRMKM